MNVQARLDFQYEVINSLLGKIADLSKRIEALEKSRTYR